MICSFIYYIALNIKNIFVKIINSFVKYKYKCTNCNKTFYRTDQIEKNRKYYCSYDCAKDLIYENE